MRLRWEKDGRFYMAFMGKDLLGEWTVTQVWGRRGTQRGKIRHFPCQDEDGCRLRLEAIDKKRRQRGYRRVAI